MSSLTVDTTLPPVITVATTDDGSGSNDATTPLSPSRANTNATIDASESPSSSPTLKDKEDKKEKKDKKDKEDKKEKKDKEDKKEKKDKEDKKEKKDKEDKKEKKDKEDKKEKKEKEKEKEKKEREVAEAEEEAHKTSGWWGRFKDTFRAKPYTIKDIVNAAGAAEATYRFDFTDFELDVLSNTVDEANKDACNMFSVHIERSAMGLQQGETKWAGPAIAYQKTNKKLKQLRKDCIEWQVNGTVGATDEDNKATIEYHEDGTPIVKLSQEEIGIQAEGSFFGIASACNQGLEYVRCPTDFGTVKEAERYIVRHRWAPSFNVVPIVANIKRVEQLEETDPFGDDADTAAKPAEQITLGHLQLDGSHNSVALGRDSPQHRRERSDVDILGSSDDESPFTAFKPDPNALIDVPPLSFQSAQGSGGSSFPGYTNTHRRHTATYGSVVGLQQAVANHQRTVSLGLGVGGGKDVSGTKDLFLGVSPRQIHHSRTNSAAAASQSPGTLSLQGAFNDLNQLDAAEIKPFITYNKTNTNCVGADSTPYISTIGVNPCEAVAAKLLKGKPNSSVVISIRERTEVELADLSKQGISPSAGGEAKTPGANGRKFTQVRLDLTKGSIAAFGGQRYELYFFDDSEEAKKERKKIKGKSDITGGLVPTIVLRFKVQGTLIDKETLEDVTAQSPARRRLLQAKIAEAPAFPYAFVLDKFVVDRNVKKSYNISAGIVKVLSGTGIAPVTIDQDGMIVKSEKEKEKEKKEKKDKKDKDDKKEKKDKKKEGADGESGEDSSDEQEKLGAAADAAAATNKNNATTTTENAAATTADGSTAAVGSSAPLPAASPPAVMIQTTELTAVPRMQPLHTRNRFKLCDVMDDVEPLILPPNPSASPSSQGNTATPATDTSAYASSGSMSTTPAANNKPSGDSPATNLYHLAAPPLKFEDLNDCFVFVPQFASMRHMTIGDLFNSNDTTSFNAMLEELKDRIPSDITREDINALMQRPLIKFQCKTEENTCKVYTQAVPTRGANVDFVLGSACTTSNIHDNADRGDAKIIATKAFNEMLYYPNPAAVQEKTAIALAPFVSLNTLPLEGIHLSTTFPKKVTPALHHYEDEFVTFRMRRFLLPSVTKAGLAPASQWDIPIEAFDNEECPYRVHEPVLSLESFFDTLNGGDDDGDDEAEEEEEEGGDQVDVDQGTVEEEGAAAEEDADI